MPTKGIAVRLLLVIVFMGLIMVGLVAIRHCGDDEATVAMPPLPTPQALDVNDVVNYAEGRAETFRVRTARDILPGGLSAAMLPLMIDWKRSDVRPDGALVVGNLSHGGNPLSGITLLRTVRLYPERLTEVQFVTVPLGGPKAFAHGQLRFIFEDGGIEILGRDPGAVGEPDAINDIVLSWEAWRGPGVEYDIMTGMDPSVYDLSLRGYSGTQRFLEDTLAQRPWTAYTLKLPGGQAGLAELLRVSLAMGDGAARQVIGKMMTQAEALWREATPDPTQENLNLVEEWLRLQQEMKMKAPSYADQRLALEGEETGYQSALRSCATMALYCVDVSVARLIEAGHPAEGMRPAHAPELAEVPEWLAGMSGAGWGDILVNAPRALGFVRANPWVIPGKVPPLLDKAGLLVRDGDEPRQVFFSLETMTPWGHRDQLLVR